MVSILISFACGTHENTVSSFRFQVAGIEIWALIQIGELGMVEAAIAWKRVRFGLEPTGSACHESLTRGGNRDGCAPVNNHR